MHACTGQPAQSPAAAPPPQLRGRRQAGTRLAGGDGRAGCAAGWSKPGLACLPAALTGAGLCDARGARQHRHGIIIQRHPLDLCSAHYQVKRGAPPGHRHRQRHGLGAVRRREARHVQAGLADGGGRLLAAAGRLQLELILLGLKAGGQLHQGGDLAQLLVPGHAACGGGQRQGWQAVGAAPPTQKGVGSERQGERRCAASAL